MDKEELLRHADQQHAEAAARLSYTVEFAKGGLQAAMLANGGALVGLFTLIAPHRDLAEKLWGSGLAFSIALALTLCSWLFTMVSQDRFQVSSTYRGWNAESKAAERQPMNDDVTEVKRGFKALVAAYTAIILSFVAFITGCLLALSALAC